jgi:hypothetical protein
MPRSTSLCYATLTLEDQPFAAAAWQATARRPGYGRWSFQGIRDSAH